MHTDTNLPEPAKKPPLDQRRRLCLLYVSSFIFVDTCRDLRVSRYGRYSRMPHDVCVTCRCSSTMRAAASADFLPSLSDCSLMSWSKVRDSAGRAHDRPRQSRDRMRQVALPRQARADCSR